MQDVGKMWAHDDASLSSWRAWIEIPVSTVHLPVSRSLSSWRAWIEIRNIPPDVDSAAVALLMESVD